MNMAETLSGRAGWAGIRWILSARPMRNVLHQALNELLINPDLLVACRLHRAKFKPGRKLTAYYDVWLRPQNGDRPGSRPIAVTWTLPENGRSPALFGPQSSDLPHTGGLPFRQLVADVPAWGMHIQVSPWDGRFPHLARVSDPHYVPSMLAAAGAAPGARPQAAYRVTPIRYRPGQRHLLRYEPLVRDDSACGTVFAKLYATEQEAAKAFRVATGISDWLSLCGSEAAAIRPLGQVTEDGIILYPAVTGRPLSWYLRQPRPVVARYLRQAGRVLQALHQAPTNLVAGGPPHDFAAEIKEIARASEHVQALLPAVGATIYNILARAQAWYDGQPPVPHSFGYGDFKSDHLWITRAGLRLIDFDTCRPTDPALDLGKFLADLQWWYNLYGQPGIAQAQADFLGGYDPELPPGYLARARLYEVLFLVKITVHRVRLFDRGWVQQTTRLINQAEALLRHG